jgi:hypothetical protein
MTQKLLTKIVIKIIRRTGRQLQGEFYFSNILFDVNLNTRIIFHF